MTPPTRLEKRLRGAQRHIGRALVGALVAEIEDAGDGEHADGAGRRRDIDLVAERDAEVLGELGADDDVIGQQTRLRRRRCSRGCVTILK